MRSGMRLIVDGELPEALEDALARVASAAVACEGVASPCFACLTVTDNAGIRALNREQRGIDAATDVLSFPTVRYPAGVTARGAGKRLAREWDACEGACALGDIVLSLERAREQATEYGHSLAREVCYLTAHGLFHLMGYDHISEGDRQAMREMEEKALREAGLSRISDEELLQRARKAMENAYVPYSRFRVGACLLCEDGAVYTGCNIENASYGLCNCAERTAVFKAVSEGHTRFTTIAIAGDSAAPWPCGACRQVLNEFAPGIRVLITWDGGRGEAPLAELLPHGFGPSSLLGEEQK